MNYSPRQVFAVLRNGCWRHGCWRHGCGCPLAWHRLVVCWLWLLACGVNALPAQVLPAKPAESPREVFKLFGMEDPFFGSFIEDEPFTADEQQKLWKILLRVRNFSLVDLERWARDDAEWKIMVAEPIPYRGEVLHLRGKATKVTRVPLDEATAAQYEMDKLYRVQMTADDDTPITIYAANVPNAWLDRADLNEPASALGVLVKRSADDSAPSDAPPAATETTAKNSRLVFAAPRVAWHPQNVLGQLGMDEGLFDTVANRRPLLTAERECFYQMLAAAKRAQPFQLEREAFAQLERLRDNLSRNRSAIAGAGAGQQQLRRQLERAERKLFDVVPLFNQPESQTGRLVMFEGDIRRAIEIPVDDPDMRQRFGINRYYELAMFTDDSQSNPLIFCVLEVPPEMPLGEDVFVRGRVAGFFLKSWAYPRGNGPQVEGKVKQQLAPMVLGREARIFTRQPTLYDRLTGSGAVVAVVLALSGILWGAWYSNRTPKRAAPANDASSSGPDFSGIE